VAKERKWGGDTYIPRNPKLEEPHAHQHTEHDAAPRREVLGDVIRVVDAQRDQHAAQRLEPHGRAHDGVVAREEAQAADGRAVGVDDSQQGRDERVEGELHVARPHGHGGGGGGGGRLEHLLEVDARQAGDQRGGQDGEDAEGVVHRRVGEGEVVVDALVGGGAAREGALGQLGGGVHGLAELVEGAREGEGGGGGGELHDDDAEGEEEEGEPFLGGEGAVEEEDAEEGCGEDLGLLVSLLASIAAVIVAI